MYTLFYIQYILYIFIHKAVAGLAKGIEEERKKDSDALRRCLSYFDKAVLHSIYCCPLSCIFLFLDLLPIYFKGW